MIRLEKVRVDLGTNSILHGLSFEFKPGLNFLIGLNGSGKTTLLKCISQDLKYKGSIKLQSQDLSKISPKEFARNIAIVHQNWNIPFNYKVIDFVLMGRFPFLAWWGAYRKEDYQFVRNELHRLKVEHLAHRSLSEVSGGELQRIFLARALSQETPILLLDEPAQSLDPKGRNAMYRLLSQLTSQQKTIICTSHDIELIQTHEAHIWAIKDGHLLYESNGQNFTSEMISSLYDLETSN